MIYLNERARKTRSLIGFHPLTGLSKGNFILCANRGLHTPCNGPSKCPNSCIGSDSDIDSDVARRVLWIRGTLGMGKSVMAGYYIDLLKCLYPKAIVAYFFCKSGQPGAHQASGCCSNPRVSVYSRRREYPTETGDLVRRAF